MPRIPLQKLPARATESLEDAWIARLSERLADAGTDRALLCRDTLLELAYPQYVGRYDEVLADAKTPLGTQLALSALDPRHVTLEPEYYGDCDQARFQPAKPLLWLWYSFDRLPIGGQAVQLGVKLRRALAPHIFKRVGKNFKCFQHVEFSFGYNMEVGDDCVVHRHVLLDDRGGIRMGNRVSISDYANIYSHTHSIVDQVDVTNALTILDDDVRITYHATVLAGVHVKENGMVGAVAVATKDVRPYHVNVGIPAKSVRVKPNAPTERVSLAVDRANE
ncbi:MAG: acyltransferase [Gemmatimonadaceae bacterium]|nr:acyltransferase [Gemmatimonadaceae bacterium]MCW5825723.1 acyltransferase [Gemmatimonadaceae bacterium]